ncbi:MAG TPA: endonuclease V, partial [Chloroflexota bacterium]|nr:endonuclease V [Chloroflexota bacterium]
QLQLSKQVVTGDEFGPVRLIAGVDNSYEVERGLTYAGVVVLTWPDLEIVERRVAATPTSFPYVPGLLSFREAPGVLAALALLTSEPDLVIFDGQGIAHMRGLGLASHLGVVLNKPAIGCAKSKLVGNYVEPGPRQGDVSPLTYHGRRVGSVLRPVGGRKALLFVSPGHRVSVASATEIVRACCRGHVMAEPIYLAHHLVTDARKGGQASGHSDHG